MNTPLTDYSGSTTNPPARYPQSRQSDLFKALHIRSHQFPAHNPPTPFYNMENKNLSSSPQPAGPASLVPLLTSSHSLLANFSLVTLGFLLLLEEKKNSLCYLQTASLSGTPAPMLLCDSFPYFIWISIQCHLLRKVFPRTLPSHSVTPSSPIALFMGLVII